MIRKQKQKIKIETFGLTDGLAIHLRIGSAEFRYVGEYRPGKQGPVAVIGNGGLPAIIFSDPYIMVIIPFVRKKFAQSNN